MKQCLESGACVSKSLTAAAAAAAAVAVASANLQSNGVDVASWVFSADEC